MQHDAPGPNESQLPKLDQSARNGTIRPIKAIFLEVRESNRAAKALYEKWAFTEEGRRKAYYTDPEEDALILKFSFPE